MCDRWVHSSGTVRDLHPIPFSSLARIGHQEQNCDKISANRMKKQVYLYFSEVQPKLMYYIKIRISERIISSLLEYFCSERKYLGVSSQRYKKPKTWKKSALTQNQSVYRAPYPETHHLLKSRKPQHPLLRHHIPRHPFGAREYILWPD